MPEIKSKHQGQNGTFYIVNPKGTVHSCTIEHAKARLRQPGWRMANDIEIETYKETKSQRFDKPFGEPWDPTPTIVDPDLPDSKADDKKINATESAIKLAKENGVDLEAVEPTGAGGRIIKSDVQAVIDGRQKPTE